MERTLIVNLINYKLTLKTHSGTEKEREAQIMKQTIAKNLTTPHAFCKPKRIVGDEWEWPTGRERESDLSNQTCTTDGRILENKFKIVILLIYDRIVWFLPPPPPPPPPSLAPSPCSSKSVSSHISFSRGGSEGGKEGRKGRYNRARLIALCASRRQKTESFSKK